jgi:hypothetical protein
VAEKMPRKRNEAVNGTKKLQKKKRHVVQDCDQFTAHNI